MFQLQQDGGGEGGAGTETPAPVTDPGQRAPGQVALRPADGGTHHRGQETQG